MLNYIPLPHKIEILNAVEVDEWGIEVFPEYPDTANCRISYNTSRETLAVSSGDEIVFNATILVEGVAPIYYNTKIRWVDDYGTEHNDIPLDIKFKKDLSGQNVAMSVVI